MNMQDLVEDIRRKTGTAAQQVVWLIDVYGHINEDKDRERIAWKLSDIETNMKYVHKAAETCDAPYFVICNASDAEKYASYAQSPKNRTDRTMWLVEMLQSIERVHGWAATALVASTPWREDA